MKLLSPTIDENLDFLNGSGYILHANRRGFLCRDHQVLKFALGRCVNTAPSVPGGGMPFVGRNRPPGVNCRETLCALLGHTALLITSLTLLTTCGIGPRGVTIEQREQLESIEGYLPIAPDSVVERYQSYDAASFHARFGRMLADAVVLVDSLNAGLPQGSWVDTIAIDHAFESYGMAALQGRTIVLSSSHFYVDENPAVIRSILFHEFGHLYYRALPSQQKALLGSLWETLRTQALFYVIRDGEYSGNCRLGGHPEDSPAELFASAFNLFHNREWEVYERVSFLPATARTPVDALRELVERGKGRTGGVKGKR